MRVTRPSWSMWALAMAALVWTGSLPAAESLDVSVAMSHPIVQTGGTRTAYLQVALTGLRSGAAEPAPVNTAIVLDQSGSMSGAKMESAKRAAILALDQLRDEDIVSVVAYQSTVDVLVPATKLYDRQAVKERIRAISTGGSTALFGGVSKGAKELEKFLSENRVNTLLLLSDGLANVGPSSPVDLARLGQSLGRQGISVSTLGLGLDYNEDLMTRLAMASDGNHFFVEDESNLEAVFAAQFGDVTSKVAQGATIRLRCRQGVRPVRVLGRAGQVAGQSVTTSINNVSRGQTRYLLVEVELGPGRAGERRLVADVDVEYYDMAVERRVTAGRRAFVEFSNSAAASERSVNRDVMVAVVQQIGTERNQVATALRDRGQIEEARKAFSANAAYLRVNGAKLDAPELDYDAALNTSASENVEGAEWKKQRKLQQERSYQNATQQLSVTPSSRPTKRKKKD